jgi:hypothetical protein
MIDARFEPLDERVVKLEELVAGILAGESNPRRVSKRGSKEPDELPFSKKRQAAGGLRPTCMSGYLNGDV